MNARPCESHAAAGGAPEDSRLSSLLGERDGACLVIDPMHATLEAANPAARALLMLDAATRLPYALDVAMPVIQRLRKIQSGSAASVEERLNFWSAGRLVSILASVSKATAPDGRRLVVVAAADGGGTETANVSSPRAEARAREATHTVPSAASPAPAASTATTPAGPFEEPSPPPVKRDDAETLREIARRIREGHVSRARAEPAAELQTTAAPSPRSDTWPEPPPPESPAAERTGPSSAPRPLPPRQTDDTADARSLSKIAHELKTPLSAIVAASEIMRDEQLGPMGNARYLGYAGDIHESAKHALGVIDAMLTGSTHEARTIEAIDLNELASMTVSAMLPLARASDILLEADCENGRIEIAGDATAVRQIIFNLVSNALKFTPAGGDVRVVTGYLADGTAFLAVRDTGDGMSEETITRAFYGDDARSGPRPGGGYGIGLPMVRHLAESMGAAIDVDSAPGKGTVVLISFQRQQTAHG